MCSHPIVLQQKLLFPLLFPLDRRTDINSNTEVAVVENCDFISQIIFISLAEGAFWHWNHSHRNCSFLLWKNTAFLFPKSYLPSFHNWNLIKSLTKQTLCISRKTPTASRQSGPRHWWTWFDERWVQNKGLYPNKPQLAWIIIITYVQYLIHMNRWKRNPAFCMLQLSVLWGIH